MMFFYHRKCRVGSDQATSQSLLVMMVLLDHLTIRRSLSFSFSPECGEAHERHPPVHHEAGASGQPLCVSVPEINRK